MLKNKTAAGLGTRAAKTTNTRNPTDSKALAQAGKALAIWLYAIGVATLDETQARFDRHPAWRTA